MGKIEQQQYLHQHQQSHGAHNPGSSGFLCQGCSMVLRRFANECSFKCFIVLILSLSVLLSGIFWIFPRYVVRSSFDANEAIKLSATVQAYFRLEKPVSQLIPYIERLEYDIYSEIGVPNTKVAVLSLHPSGVSNQTDVVFGVLSDPMSAPINPVYLSVMRSSLVELFLEQSNLILTTSLFGNASMFEILKFPGGITVIPVQSASIWQIPQILFNFTLYNSVAEVLDNFVEFKDELKLGLYLMSYENVFVQITNGYGSTIDPPVTVQASVMTDSGGLLPQRLKQLAQTITGSRAKNLGLDNLVFGRVKEISLSSFLKGTLHASPPSASPAPSPQLIDYAEPMISPYPIPSHSPLSPPTATQAPCFDCEVSSPVPSIVTENPPHPCPFNGLRYPPSSSNPSFPPDYKPAAGPTSDSASPATDLSPDLSRIAEGSKPSQGTKRAAKLVSQSVAPSPISSAGSSKPCKQGQQSAMPPIKDGRSLHLKRQRVEGTGSKPKKVGRPSHLVSQHSAT